MLQNFKIIIEYDGAGYHGWQRQPKDRTIQEEIEKALETMTGDGVTLTGSGRTDAGVHALGQVANFKCDTAISPDVFQKGLNSLLPDDIIIRSCHLIDVEFHARFNAKSKRYHYRILNDQLPAAIGRGYFWHIKKHLNVGSMGKAISGIKGEHDFKAFEGAGSPRAHTTRRVIDTGIEKRQNGFITITIEANGFLRYMVRNIVGSLVDVGLEKMAVSEFLELLKTRDRTLAGITAPARGLFLMEVKY